MDAFVRNGLHVERHGDGPETLLLIHGLGANGAVWDPLLALAARDWRGRILVPDLAGHGLSSCLPTYSVGAFAASLSGLFEPGEKVHLIGHSLGGALGGLLASGWFGIEIESLLALSVKTRWSEAEVEKGRAVARNPLRWRETRAEAEENYLRAAGLGALADKTPRSRSLGIVEKDGRFRVATDPGVYACAAMGMAEALKTARRQLTFATGEIDAMAPAADAEAAGIRARVIPGVGHNAHVEAPEEVWALLMGAR